MHTNTLTAMYRDIGIEMDDSAYISINDSGCVVSMCSADGKRFDDWMEKHAGMKLLITSRKTACNIVGKPLTLSERDIISM